MGFVEIIAWRLGVYIMGDTMAISRADLLKDLFKYGANYLKQVNQVIANEAIKQKELEHIKQAGKTFRDAVKTAHIIENEKRLKDIQNAIQEQSR